MKFLFSICGLSLSLLLSLAHSNSASAEADDDTSNVIKDLCSGGQTEGRYSIGLKGIGVFRIYLVCVGTTSIATTVAEPVSGVGSIESTMMYVSVDDDDINFTAFKPGLDDAKEMGSQDSDPRIKLNIEALKHGEMIGKYRGLSSRQTIKFDIKRDLEFPQIYSLADLAGDYRAQLIGTFEFKESKIGDLKFASRPRITNDVIAHIQRITVQLPSGNVRLLGGIDTPEKGNVFSASSGVPGTPGVPMIHVREILVPALHPDDPPEIDVYYFTTVTGMVGPERAVKIDDELDAKTLGATEGEKTASPLIKTSSPNAGASAKKVQVPKKH